MKFSNVLQNLLKENLQFDFTSFSTARLADRILVLENGTLLESGTHQDLLKPMVICRTFFNLARGYQ
jgi:ABC-type transport system involved in Fe-S cluster assembly fused permease/ATPase subunit